MQWQEFCPTYRSTVVLLRGWCSSGVLQAHETRNEGGISLYWEGAYFCREEDTDSLISKTLKPLAATGFPAGIPVKIACVEEGRMEMGCEILEIGLGQVCTLYLEVNIHRYRYITGLHSYCTAYRNLTFIHVGKWLEAFLLLAFSRDRKRCSCPGEYCFNARVYIIHIKRKIISCYSWQLSSVWVYLSLGVFPPDLWGDLIPDRIYHLEPFTPC